MTYQLNFPALWPYLPELLSGLLITIELTAIATLGGIALGIVGAAIRCSHDPRLNKVILRRVWSGYVEIVRNTPFVVQLFFIVFGLPTLGLKLSAGQAAVLAMTINLGAYSTEIIRAGIQASAKGQWEAGSGKSTGFEPQSDIFSGDFTTVIAAHLSSTGQPMHHCDARLCGGVAGVIRRTDICCQPDSVTYLPQF